MTAWSRNVMLGDWYFGYAWYGTLMCGGSFRIGVRLANRVGRHSEDYDTLFADPVQIDEFGRRWSVRIRQAQPCATFRAIAREETIRIHIDELTDIPDLVR